MTTRTKPVSDHLINSLDALALADYWDAQAKRGDNNAETIAVCEAEAKHWRDVAITIDFLLNVTPFEYPSCLDPQFQLGQR